METLDGEEEDVGEVGPVEHLKISSPSHHWQGTK